jgi:hypothetical protein
VSEKKITFSRSGKEKQLFTQSTNVVSLCFTERKRKSCSFSAWLKVEESWSQEQGTWKSK